MIRHLYNLHSDHLHKPILQYPSDNTHSYYNANIYIPMPYFISPWLYCNNQIMLLSPACSEAGAQTKGHSPRLEALWALWEAQLEAVEGLIQGQTQRVRAQQDVGAGNHQHSLWATEIRRRRRQCVWRRRTKIPWPLCPPPRPISYWYRGLAVRKKTCTYHPVADGLVGRVGIRVPVCKGSTPFKGN